MFDRFPKNLQVVEVCLVISKMKSVYFGEIESIGVQVAREMY